MILEQFQYGDWGAHHVNESAKIVRGMKDFQIRRTTDTDTLQMPTRYNSYANRWDRLYSAFVSYQRLKLMKVSKLERLMVGRGVIFHAGRSSSTMQAADIRNIIPLVTMLTKSDMDVRDCSTNPRDYVLIVNPILYTNEEYKTFKNKIEKEIFQPCIEKGVRMEIRNIPFDMLFDDESIQIDFSTAEQRAIFDEKIFEYLENSVSAG